MPPHRFSIGIYLAAHPVLRVRSLQFRFQKLKHVKADGVLYSTYHNCAKIRSTRLPTWADRRAVLATRLALLQSGVSESSWCFALRDCSTTGRSHTTPSHDDSQHRPTTLSRAQTTFCHENTREREVTQIYHAKARCETGVVYCLDGTWDKRARCLREDLRELVRLLPFMLLPRSRFRGLPFLTVTSPHALRSHWLQLVADLQMPRRASLTRDRVVHT